MAIETIETKRFAVATPVQPEVLEEGSVFTIRFVIEPDGEIVPVEHEDGCLIDIELLEYPTPEEAREAYEANVSTEWYVRKRVRHPGASSVCILSPRPQPGESSIRREFAFRRGALLLRITAHLPASALTSNGKDHILAYYEALDAVFRSVRLGSKPNPPAPPRKRGDNVTKKALERFKR